MKPLVRSGAPGARTLNPRIKSLSGAGSPGFMSVRAADQTVCAYPGEQGRALVNCNPNCYPGLPTARLGLELHNSTAAMPGRLWFRPRCRGCGGVCCLRTCLSSRMVAASCLEFGLGEIAAVHVRRHAPLPLAQTLTSSRSATRRRWRIAVFHEVPGAKAGHEPAAPGPGDRRLNGGRGHTAGRRGNSVGGGAVRSGFPGVACHQHGTTLWGLLPRACWWQATLFAGSRRSSASR
jgi:hypothetical protein